MRWKLGSNWAADATLGLQRVNSVERFPQTRSDVRALQTAVVYMHNKSDSALRSCNANTFQIATRVEICVIDFGEASFVNHCLSIRPRSNLTALLVSSRSTAESRYCALSDLGPEKPHAHACTMPLVKNNSVMRAGHPQFSGLAVDTY